MKITLKFAEKSELEKVKDFFCKHIFEDTSWITNREFLCPDWIMWAVLRKQVIIVLIDNIVFWALRFYPRKRDNIVMRNFSFIKFYD